MSATTHDNVKTVIETEYAPGEDDSFAENSDTVDYSGVGSCYASHPDYNPWC